MERAEAVRRSAMELAFCGACQHIYNIANQAQLVDYSLGYENALHYSPRIREYLEDLADRLIERYDIRSAAIVEMGCGDGYFLDLLCRKGNNHAVGFDPAAPKSSPYPRVQFVRDFYSAKYSHLDARLVICRHVLEHIADPVAMLRATREALQGRRDAVLYLEVPNARYMIEELAIWDVFYEHCSYFTPRSLSRACAEAGLKVISAEETFAGQYLSVDAQPAQPEPAAATISAPVPASAAIAEEPQLAPELIREFAASYGRTIERWRAWLGASAASHPRLALWGAGTKSVMFLNVLQPGSRFVYVVDVNPRKEGTYIPGTGHRIAPPAALRESPPDAVVLLNPQYRGEVGLMLDALGIQAELLVAEPPSAGSTGSV